MYVIMVEQRGDILSKFILYTLSTCPVCDRTRATLLERGTSFEERVIDDREDWQNEVIAQTKQYTVPVLQHPDGTIEVGFEGETG